MTALAALGRPDSKFQSLLSTPVAVVVGVIGAILTVVLARQPELGLALGCIGVAILYSVYPTFSLAWGNGRERLIEWAFLSVGIASILLAISVDPRWLALGWAAHGTWDALHHRDHHVVGLRGIPLWYIQTCLVWDVPAAIGLLVFL
jgi:hypothetical protein